MQLINKIKQEKNLRYLYGFSLLFFTVLLPFQFRWLPITLGIMLMGLFWVFSLSFGKKLRLLVANRLAGVVLLYYLVIAIASLYSPMPDKAAKDLLLKLPFIAWTLMLSSIAVFNLKHLQLFLRAFVLASAASMVYCFLDSLYSYLSFPHTQVFYFEELVNYSMIPPHYLGMFINFSYALVLYGLLSGKRLFHSTTWSIILLIFFFISLVMISVRMQYLVFVVVNAWLVFGYLKKSRSQAVMGFFLVVVFFGGLTLAVPGSRSRIIDTYNELKAIGQPSSQTQTNPRLYLWNAGAEVIANNFWTGTGTGAENKALNQRLSDDEIVYWDGTKSFYLHEKKYNYHNSYLQHFAATGIAGLVSLLLLFVAPALSRKRHPLKSQRTLFLLICGISFATESMLQRQAGVLFFSFFYGLFFVLPLKAEKPHAAA